MIGVFTGAPEYKVQVWIHTALQFESDEDLNRQAHAKVEEHATKRGV
jgi:hypothetical protein